MRVAFHRTESIDHPCQLSIAVHGSLGRGCYFSNSVAGAVSSLLDQFGETGWRARHGPVLQLDFDDVKIKDITLAEFSRTMHVLGAAHCKQYGGRWDYETSVFAERAAHALYLGQGFDGLCAVEEDFGVIFESQMKLVLIAGIFPVKGAVEAEPNAVECHALARP